MDSAPRHFHCFIQSRAETARRGPAATVEGCCVPTLALDEADRARPFRVSFDEVADGLLKLPGLYWEPDGSFVWVGTFQGGAWPWRLEGQVTDAGAAVAFLELQGHCRAGELDQVLSLLNWPAEPVLFQVHGSGVLLEEVTFRQVYLAGLPPTTSPCGETTRMPSYRQVDPTRPEPRHTGPEMGNPHDP